MKDEDKKAYMPMTEKLGVLLVDVPEPKKISIAISNSTIIKIILE